MSNLSLDTESFITEFDAAIESHMEWTRRILRCAVLHISPGDDVLLPAAHNLCRFGRWFKLNREHFEGIDEHAVQPIEVVHQTMHNAIRSICSNVMTGKPGLVSDLEIFERSQSELLTLLAKLKTLTLSNAVRRDPLTGLPLRHGIESDFTLCKNDAVRNRTQLFVAMIDVDHFKVINDTYGHPVGDAVLRHLAETLKQSLRINDPLYRYGGEEFLWIMRCESVEVAEQSAQRIVSKVNSAPVAISDSVSISLSVTVGLAHVGDMDDISSAIKRADAALYKGKHEGRNRYVVDRL